VDGSRSTGKTMSNDSSSRARPLLVLCCLLVASWCVMTFTHELGHLVGGWCSGATLTQFELRPWRLPYSFFEPDPHPLVTLWAGPILGAVVPVLIACVVRRTWAWFIAHFCLLANGTYLAVSWFSGDSQLDTTKLLRHGAHPLPIVLYCVVTIVVGYVGFRAACIGILDGARKKVH